MLDDVGRWLSPVEVAAIKKIPLPMSSTGDSLVWAQNRSGVFSVKSGYHFAKSSAAGGLFLHASSSTPLSLGIRCGFGRVAVLLV